MSYVVLDNNRFYAEGLRYALLRRNVMMEVHSGTVQWQPLLLESTTLVIRCRFSITGTHQSLVDILLTPKPMAGEERAIWCVMKKLGAGHLSAQAF